MVARLALVRIYLRKDVAFRRLSLTKQVVFWMNNVREFVKQVFVIVANNLHDVFAHLDNTLCSISVGSHVRCLPNINLLLI
ncbi:unnamed protein product [Thelazia callipaeda]|uniref:Transposase n=1 Tax=Thelazia callipaeda TaxID=103827 RepID=A0A0N5D7M8_THECL|nr:unnamed protein product [Thelazia callipaeda]